jgi:hypothetical protein
VRRLRPELWPQKNWLLNHDNAPSDASFSAREFLTKNNMTVAPPTLLFSVSPIEVIEVIEPKSQAVLNTLTEHDFHYALKQMAEALRTVHTRGRGLVGQ